ncbi:hypothetical protein MUP35_01895 [Patescibacteria group bacterium]|nr:hypothetical protein [Patescibacteria group bacterium]
MPYKDSQKTNECNRRYYRRNIIKIKESRIKRRDKMIATRRQTCLGTSKGVFRNLMKRKYPDNSYCELCKRKVSRLDYHHWDDSKLNQGMWICRYCHAFCERSDDGFYPVYLELKKNIELAMPHHIEECMKNKKILKKEEIIKLLKEGKQGAEISRLLKVNVDYVSHIKSINNIPTTLKWTPEKEEYLINNYKRGRAKEIANKLGLTLPSIYTKICKVRIKKNLKRIIGGE